MKLPIKIRRLNESVPIPEYQTPGAIAFDLSVSEETTIEPGERKIIPTGLVICIPEGYGLILAARSSNVKKGLMMANGIGVIDQDYCGADDELHISLYNYGKEAYTVKKWERVAQGFFVPILVAEFEEIKTLNNSSRGGFGTTG